MVPNGADRHASDRNRRIYGGRPPNSLDTEGGSKGSLMPDHEGRRMSVGAAPVRSKGERRTVGTTVWFRYWQVLSA